MTYREMNIVKSQFFIPNLFVCVKWHDTCRHLHQLQMLSSKSSSRTRRSPMPRCRPPCHMADPRTVLVPGSSEFRKLTEVVSACGVWPQLLLYLCSVWNWDCVVWGGSSGTWGGQGVQHTWGRKEAHIKFLWGTWTTVLDYCHRHIGELFD
jgi:hypothetical protein